MSGREQMSLWIYKCNNSSGGTSGRFFGDWYEMFDKAGRSPDGGQWWGGPAVTEQPLAHQLAESAQIGQRMLCWQRWSARPKYEIPAGLRAGAVGIVELVGVRSSRRSHDTWRLRPVSAFDEPVPLLELKARYPGISRPFRNPISRGTFIELTSSEERSILRVCADFLGDHHWDAPEVRSVEQQRTGGASAGFGVAAENAKVERAAVDTVTDRLAAAGWTVTSVELERCGYDLRARRGRGVRHVEVKGVRGRGTGHLITAGEVRQANDDPHWEIWIVTSALSEKPKVTTLTGAEFLLQFDRLPVTYKATPKAPNESYR